jgi:hypothetical protein
MRGLVVSLISGPDAISDDILNCAHVSPGQRQQSAIGDFNGSARYRPEPSKSGPFNEHGDELRKCLERTARVHAENRERDGTASAECQRTLVCLGGTISGDGMVAR